MGKLTLGRLQTGHSMHHLELPTSCLSGHPTPAGMQATGRASSPVVPLTSRLPQGPSVGAGAGGADQDVAPARRSTREEGLVGSVICCTLAGAELR